MNDSQRINNWLTLVSIIVISATLMIYSKYIAPYQQQKAATIAKIDNNPCQENSSVKYENMSCSDKIYDKLFIQEGLKLLQNGQYTLNGGMIVDTKNDNNLTIEQTDKVFIDIINISQDDKAIRTLNINYEIIEKQNGTQIGYFLSSFRINNKHLYRIKIDLQSFDIEEIKKRIELTIESFKYNAEI